jgi:ABC-type uncharacterized transport system involved in gliding motility auxiliary subunit
MIFQCLGITGAILLLYGLLAFAVTHSSSWFFWTLIGTGLASLLTFFVMALNRSWQKIIGVFLAFNSVWVMLYFLSDRWPILSGKIIFAAMILLNVAFLWVAKSFLKEMFQSRSMRYGTSAAIYSMIVGFILIVINIGSQDFNKQFDFTAEKINTLSEQTVKVITSLPSPIKITAFYENQSQETAPIKEAMKNLLDRYKATTKNIEVLFVDPDKEKILAQEKHTGDGDILVEFNGQSHITKDATEQGVTQAILKVTRTNTPNICFTSGHGEMGLEDKEDNPRSLSILKASLSNEGYEPKTLESLADSIPSDCMIVVIPSPEQRFPESEVSVIEKYLDNGGKLIALLDPLLPNTKIEQSKFSIARSGFEDFMKKWGVNLGNNLMLEKHLMVFQGEVVDLSVRASNYGNHPIVDSLKGKQTYFNTVQSVEKQNGFSGTSIELIKSLGDKKSWAETNIDLLFRSKKADPDGADILGPVNIAMAIEKEGKEPKQKSQLIVIGDGDFISNGLIQSYEFNYDLFLNALNWMSGDVEKISIRPKKIKTSAIELTPEESNTLFYLAIITLPMLVLIFGINLWWYRRRRG